MFGARPLDVQGCFAFSLEHQAWTGRSPGVSLVCAPCHEYFPRVWTSSELHVRASVLCLLAPRTGLDLVVLKSDLSGRADQASSLARDQETGS